MHMTFTECKRYILSDLGWFTDKTGIKLFFKIIQLMITSPSFNVTLWFRIGNYIKGKKCPPLLYLIQYICVRKKFKTGIDLPLGTDIGYGLLFAHLGCIVVNGSVKIGDYVIISQGVTLGSVRGKEKARPIIGNNVYIGAGAKVIGGCTIGNNVVIGAGAVVTKDVPDNAVVAGVPAKILNYKGKDYLRYYQPIKRIKNEKI